MKAILLQPLGNLDFCNSITYRENNSKWKDVGKDSIY